MRTNKLQNFEFACNKVIVLELLQIDDLKYNRLQFQYGMQYIDHISDTAAGARELSQDSTFWEWWVHTWNCMDHTWLADVEYRQSALALLYEYKQLHYPMRLYSTLPLPQNGNLPKPLMRNIWLKQ